MWHFKPALIQLKRCLTMNMPFLIIFSIKEKAVINECSACLPYILKSGYDTIIFFFWLK